MMGYPDDRDIARDPRPKEKIEGLPLFAMRPLDWPEAPAAGVEQGVLPIRKATIEGNYRAWLATVAGERVLHEFCKQALEDMESGCRLSAKLIWELVRRKLKVEMNNDYHALLVRDAEAKHPQLAGKFEKRRRQAV
jgi:hypothetical protein